MATISYAGSVSTYTTSQVTVNFAHGGSTVNNWKLYCNSSQTHSDSFTATGSFTSTQRTVTGLTPSTLYEFRIEFYLNSNLIHSASGSYTSAAMPVPAALSGLSVSVNGTAPNAAVTASWNATDGASSYDWQVVAASQSGSVTTTSKQITITSAGNYNFTVYPKNSSGEGSGQSVSFSVSNPPVPSPLSNLVVTPSGYTPNTTVVASWDLSSGATGYRWSTNASTSDGIKNGAVTGNGKTITVISPAGGYQFTVTPYNSSGDGTGLTKSFPVVDPPIPIPSSPSISSRFEGGFNVSWGSISGGTHYQLGYKSSVNPSWTTITTTTNSTSLNLNQWGMDYDLRARASNNNGSSYGDWSTTTVAITNPKTPTLAGVYNAGSGTATLTVGGMSGANSTFDVVIVEMKRTSDNVLIDTKSTTVNGGQVQFFTYNSAQIKLYYFRAYARQTRGAGTVYSLGYSDHVSFSRPDNFAWTYSGCELFYPFSLINGATKDATKGFYCTAQEWNDLIANVLEVRAHKGLGGFSYNSAVQGVKPEADQFNQVRNAIAAMKSTGLPAPKIRTIRFAQLNLTIWSRF